MQSLSQTKGSASAIKSLKQEIINLNNRHREILIEIGKITTSLRSEIPDIAEKYKALELLLSTIKKKENELDKIQKNNNISISIPKNRKKTKVFLILGLLAIIIYGILYSLPYRQQYNDVNKIYSKTNTQADYRIYGMEFAREFSVNKLAAEEKYNGKTIIIDNSPVVEIDRSTFGKIYLLIDERYGGKHWIKCTIREEESPKLKAINVEDQTRVSIQGIYKGISRDTIFLDDCVIVLNEKSNHIEKEIKQDNPVPIERN